MKTTYNPLNFNRVFIAIAAIFVISLAYVVIVREGKDLKVGLYGVQQVIDKKSPYDNPLDPKRPLFRYAPGFAIMQYPFMLNSKMTTAFVFNDITYSSLAWYLVSILSLLVSAWLLLKLISGSTRAISARNLKISILMAIPLIGYELSNGQNKLLALAFLLAAIYFFERKKDIFSSLFLNLAMTVYIPLFIFSLYFILRSKGRYILSFLAGLILVFLILPSMFFGIGYNIFLLNEWFTRCLQPFFFTTSYASYTELRASSQSLPSALGRLFVPGVHPTIIHLLIRVFSYTIVLFSCLAVWKHANVNRRGLEYAIFLILGLILPSYCIYYTWAWLFVIYFVLLNYMSDPNVTLAVKKRLRVLMIIMFASSWLISVHFFNQVSLLFWSTLILWFGIAEVRWRETSQ